MTQNAKVQLDEVFGPKRVSTLTIASFIALGKGLLLMALAIAIVLVDNMYIAGATGRPYRESLTARVLVLNSIALPTISILGGGMGIGGLLNTNRSKRLAWLSVLGNVAILLFVCGLWALSILFEGYGSTP